MIVGHDRAHRSGRSLRSAPIPDPLDSLPADATWLETLNVWRVASVVAPVTENASWSVGAFTHAKYMVETRDYGHDEGTGGPFSTPEGIAAGVNGNVAVSGNATKTDRGFVEQWVTAPFHAAGMLDPQLATIGVRLVSQAGRNAVSGRRDARRASRPDRAPRDLRRPCPR